MSSENQRETASEDLRPKMLHERLDYAWKWFDYHAKQRVSMFNFFLIASGLFATAYVNALKEGENVLGAVLSFLGAIIAAAFVVLDLRNATLVYLGEDVLRRLEREDLFAGFSGLTEELKEAPYEGIIYRDAIEGRTCCKCWTRHKYWLRLVEALVAIGFALGGVYALVKHFDP